MGSLRRLPCSVADHSRLIFEYTPTENIEKERHMIQSLVRYAAIALAASLTVATAEAHMKPASGSIHNACGAMKNACASQKGHMKRTRAAQKDHMKNACGSNTK